MAPQSVSGVTSSSLTPTTSPAATTPPPSSSGHISPTTSTTAKITNGMRSGTVAGIAVACIVAGIIIGSILAFLILKSRRRRQDSTSKHVALQRQDRQDQDRHDRYKPAPKDDFLLGDFLLTERSDKEISEELETLGQLIQQHIENNYHMHPIQLNTSASRQALEELGFESDSGVTFTHIISLAQDPRTRFAAIQHIISRVVLNSLEPGSRSLHSMLPAYVLNFAREIPPVERHRGSPEAVSVAFTRWRQLAAFLLNPQRSERGTLQPQSAHLTGQAKQTVVALNQFLGPLVDPDKRYEQESHLQDVIIECGKFEYFLFSQPGQFQLQFPQGQTHEIVTLPALEKIGDEQGNMYAIPQVVSKLHVENL